MTGRLVRTRLRGMTNTTTETTERCSVCGEILARTIRPASAGEWTVSPSWHCGAAATVSHVQADGAEIDGVTVGMVVEADIYRGGREDDDGVTTGSRLVTKRGRIVSVGSYGPTAHNTNISIRFDDGDFQNASISNRNGSTPGYPCAAWRVATA